MHKDVLACLLACLLERERREDLQGPTPRVAESIAPRSAASRSRLKIAGYVNDDVSRRGPHCHREIGRGTVRG
jgi:hypothetical protein